MLAPVHVTARAVLCPARRISRTFTQPAPLMVALGPLKTGGEDVLME